MLRVRNISLTLSSSRDTGMLATQMILRKHVMEPCIHIFECFLAASEIFSDRLKALGIEELMQTVVLRKIQPNVYLSKNILGHKISNLTKSFKCRRNIFVGSRPSLMQLHQTAKYTLYTTMFK